MTRLMICVCCVVLSLPATIESKCMAQEERQLAAVEVLTKQEWQQVDTSIDKALQWLASRQQRNGSFPTMAQGQPGVTSLCTMAFAAHGHLPGEGPYGEQLSKAVDYVLSCQKPSGLLAQVAPRGVKISRQVSHDIGTSAVYNHAIASLLLSEVYAMGGADRAARLQSVIEKSLEVTIIMQSWPKPREVDEGGWRYLHPFHGIDSDLSLTGWQLMFLRSAKNAGFDVSDEPIDRAVKYVQRCFRPKFGIFNYTATEEDRRSRAMAGAGVLALAHAGFHNSQEAKAAGEWILQHDFDSYNEIETFTQTEYYKDRYHYGVFNCSQAMYQLGGRYWQEFFPPLLRTLLANQRTNGSWPAENHYEDGKFGPAYTTALVVMALGAPNQLLPIFQR